MEEGECFSCDKCNFKTTSNVFLEQHMMKRHVIFICDICNFETAKKQRLRDHLRFLHYGITHECELCTKNFTGKNLLQEHMTRDHASKMANCGTRSIRNDKKHKSKMKKKSLFACNQCEKIFKRKDRAEEHTRWHDGVTFDCFICKIKCKRADSLKIHIKSFHSDEKYQIQCFKCGKAFKRNDKLKNHIEEKHTNNASTRKIYKCDQCERVFKNRQKAKRHTKWHDGLTYDCSICKKKYARQDGLKKHIKTRHSNEVYRCLICDQTFKRKCKLKYHNKQQHEPNHNEECPCSKCEMVSAKIDKLKIHVENNPRENSHLCSVCSLSFPSSPALESHLVDIKHQTNVDLQTFLNSCFPCTKCDESLQSENDLKSHLKEQHGVKVRSGNDGKGVKLKRGEHLDNSGADIISTNKQSTTSPEKGEAISRSPLKKSRDKIEKSEEKGQLRNRGWQDPNVCEGNKNKDHMIKTDKDLTGDFSEKVFSIFLPIDLNKSEIESDPSKDTITTQIHGKDSLLDDEVENKLKNHVKTADTTDVKNENTRDVKKGETVKDKQQTDAFESRLREILELKKAYLTSDDDSQRSDQIRSELIQNKHNKQHVYDNSSEETHAVQIILADNLIAENKRLQESNVSKIENLCDTKSQSKASFRSPRPDIQDEEDMRGRNVKKKQKTGNFEHPMIDIDPQKTTKVAQSDVASLKNIQEKLADELQMTDNKSITSKERNTKTILFDNQIVSFVLHTPKNQPNKKNPRNDQAFLESFDSINYNQSEVNAVQKLTNANLKATLATDGESESRREKIRKMAKDKDKLGSRFLQKISMVESALSGSDLKEFQNLARKGLFDKNMKYVLQDFIVNLKKKRRSGENNVIIIE